MSKVQVILITKTTQFGKVLFLCKSVLVLILTVMTYECN
jgi:hypothetical protein